MRDVRLGTRVVQTMQKGVMYEKAGHVITGLGIVGEVDGDDPQYSDQYKNTSMAHGITSHRCNLCSI